MENLIETLQKRFKSYGRFVISIEIDDVVYSTSTTNTLAIDAAFDDCYDDEDNTDRYYESRRAAQESLVDEILTKNYIEVY